MKRSLFLAVLASVTTLAIASQAAVVTVTTTNNVTPPAGKTSLFSALQGLHDGDQIQFNIDGTGPFYIQTPIGGYPLITNNHVTIDGYTQPGSSPNSNPILGGNNARIQIILDSSDDASSASPDPSNPDLLFRRSTRLIDYNGYSDKENAILGAVTATNLTVRGISFLGRHTDGSTSDPSIYCVGLAKGCLNAKLQGCWFGLAPDATNMFPAASAIAAFRETGTDTNWYSAGLVFGTDGDGTNDVAEFNITCGMHITIAIQAPNVKISGNYINVFPNGLSFVDVEQVHNDLLALGLNGDDTSVEFIENGRVCDNSVIGTDGDGKSDSNERNIVVHANYDHDVEFYSAATNVVIAGNYFGVGVDGFTAAPLPTSNTPDLISMSGNGSVRVGSNGDGVSDSVEGNLIVNTPGQKFVDGGAGMAIVARLNTMVNNSFAGFPFADFSNADWEAYYATAMVDPTAPQPVITGITNGIMSGTLPAPLLTTYTNHVVDIYLVDGPNFTNNNLTLPGTWVGSFVEGSAADKDPATNSFQVSLLGMPIPPQSLVAIAVTYTGAAKGTPTTNSLTGPISLGATADIPLFTPGSIESVGLTRIVPDKVLDLYPNNLPSLGNWEPYTGVLGTSTFLIEGNTYADGTTDQQTYVVAAQPAIGGASVVRGGFSADNGTSYRGVINSSRENGNPGRVTADRRPGAVNYMVGAETTAYDYSPFLSDNRWNLGFDYSAPDGVRFGTVQTFSLSTTTLAATMLCKAFDSADGRLTSGQSASQQATRFGGDVICLDNGNFVSVVEDRTNLRNPTGDCTTATIIAPDGSIVKESFVVAVGDIWSNATSYRGGFAVRVNGVIYLFDNTGHATGQIAQTSSGEAFSTDRGDGTRIAGHINSPYIYLAGKVLTGPTVRVAAFDTRDQSFVAKADVSEPGFPGNVDRTTVTVDALDRLVVSWESLPDGYTLNQVAARVLALDATGKVINALTPSFLTFINAAPTGNIHSFRMSVAMTTKQILVAAKGEINLNNNPGQGANSPTELNFYTVFTHPFPQDDPTAPVGGGQTPTLTISVSGGSASISWPAAATGFTLESKNTLKDPTWTVVGTQNPTSVNIGTGSKFYRLRK